MTEEKKNLGTGLDSLLGGSRPSSQGPRSLGEIHKIKLEDLTPGQYQPRTKMKRENLEELAESIKSEGVLQPIIVKSLASGRYEIVAGERRWRASKLAGLKLVPAIIRELNNDQTAKIALIENLQREDLNAMDLSRGLHRLQKEFNLSQEELGVSVGKSRSAVANLLRLTRLCKETQEALERGQVEMGHARALLTLSDESQALITKKIIKESLSVRATERLVKKESQEKPPLKETKKEDPNIAFLEKELSDYFGSSVVIRHKTSGKGTLVLSYKNSFELEGILKKIKK